MQPVSEELRKDFLQLRGDANVPAIMKAKLELIAADLIPSHVPCPLILGALAEEDSEALRQIKHPEKLALFESVVSCLSGRLVITYLTRERISFRKDRRLSLWKTSFLSLTSHTLEITKKTPADLRLKAKIIDLKISKQIRIDHNKFVIDFIYAGEKMALAFDLEIVCNRVYRILLSLQAEKKKLKQN